MIYVEDLGLSISNDEDWLQMAKFHAEWSKKFYYVFMPYMDKYTGKIFDAKICSDIFSVYYEIEVVRGRIEMSLDEKERIYAFVDKNVK